MEAINTGLIHWLSYCFTVAPLESWMKTKSYYETQSTVTIDQKMLCHHHLIHFIKFWTPTLVCLPCRLQNSDQQFRSCFSIPTNSKTLSVRTVQQSANSGGTVRHFPSAKRNMDPPAPGGVMNTITKWEKKLELEQILRPVWLSSLDVPGG